jgi:dTDP-4-amino-4,6-dideoxygalactose transaminase
MNAPTPMEKIPWSRPDVGADELREITSAFDADWLTMGPKVKAFEAALAARVAAPHAIAVSNGSVALDIALLVSGIKRGDEVIVPALTYWATAAAVSRIGAVPVFVDIENRSYNLDPALIEPAMSDRTKALLFIDYGGSPADVNGILRECDRLGITPIQDAAHSLGAIYKGAPMGCNTKISTMSFHMAKVLACVEGGMIFTQDEAMAAECRIWRNQGESAKYLHRHIGFNARMTDITAAVGLAQERKVDGYLRERARVAARYDERFHAAKNVTLMPCVQPDSRHANFLYSIRVSDQAGVAQALRDRGIDTRICYPMPLSEQEAYVSEEAPFRATPSPLSEGVSKSVINLPIFPTLTEAQVDRVADTVLEVVGR